MCQIDEKDFVAGRGHRKSREQLLPAYNIQIGVADEYIAVVDVMQYRSDIHRAMLRMNRSIQAEGTFGIMKYDRWYKRTVRRGLESVRLELFLVSIGHNLYKYHNIRMKLRGVA